MFQCISSIHNCRSYRTTLCCNQDYRVNNIDQSPLDRDYRTQTTASFHFPFPISDAPNTKEGEEDKKNQSNQIQTYDTWTILPRIYHAFDALAH